ncbi:hypothetical protein KAR34_10595 [bacterium]|nr:hypothetical protein [bacterium]
MDHFKKIFLAGVGALSLSKDRAKIVVRELIAQGKIREKEGRKLVNDMMKRAESTRKDVEHTINEQVAVAVKKINLVTQDQLKKTERRIHDLERELARKNKTASTARKTVKKTTTVQKKSSENS